MSDQFKPLHIHTPLIESAPLTRELGIPVFLKMEALQPSGSFKLRGIGLLCQRSYAEGKKHFISSSGGNAGMAVAYAGRKLKAKVTVVVPKTTGLNMRQKIVREGAKLVVHGSCWDEAHVRALELSKSAGGQLIHPFDDPIIWEGHSTLVDELVAEDCIPDGIILAVGGGGLFCGVARGLIHYQLKEMSLICVEPEGAASFYESVKSGTRVLLPKVSTIATSLATRSVNEEALVLARKVKVIPCKVTDAMALKACVRFADDHRVLVEPACGIALAAAYEKLRAVKKMKSLVVVVCGGVGVDLDLIEIWRQKVE